MPVNIEGLSIQFEDRTLFTDSIGHISGTLIQQCTCFGSYQSAHRTRRRWQELGSADSSSSQPPAIIVPLDYSDQALLGAFPFCLMPDEP